ncbi:MAG: hypothetical protein ACT4P6_22345 [Gemmatimonadaceae bacterium]
MRQSRQRHLFLAAVCAQLASASLLAAQTPQPIKCARFPHVANDGTIAFTYQDDIWIANADGGAVRRLTVHVARDVGARFSPDGQWIVFTSNRMGNNDVYVIPVSGGEPRQLTWHSGDDQAIYWTPDPRRAGRTPSVHRCIASRSTAVFRNRWAWMSVASG